MTSPRLVLNTYVVLSALLFHAGALSWLRGAPAAFAHSQAEISRSS